MKKFLNVILGMMIMISFVACDGGGNNDVEFISGEYECNLCHGDGEWDCERCGGTGKYNGEKCPSCFGIGGISSCSWCDDTGKRDAILKKYPDGRVEFGHYE